MMIGFFVNDLEREHPNYTTTVLAHMAADRGHRVCYITPADFVLNADDTLSVHGRFLPQRKYKDRAEFFATLKDGKAIKTERLDVTDIDVVMLRNDPSIDAQTPWAMEAGILFGREAVRRGTIVLNDPDSLGRASNKLYFQGFPVEARAETLITKHASDIKAFAKAHGGNIILKPLQGSGGSGVFKLDPKNASNLNQMIEAIGRDGYIIAQAYVPAAKKGDIRLFLMNGRRHPLQQPRRGHRRSRRDRRGRAQGRRDHPPQAARRWHVPDRGRHRRGQDPRGKRVFARQLAQLLGAGGGRLFSADPRLDRAQGRDQVAICARLRQPASCDPLRRGWRDVRLRPIADVVMRRHRPGRRADSDAGAVAAQVSRSL